MRKKFLIVCLTLLCCLLPCVSACNGGSTSSTSSDNGQTEQFNPVLNELDVQISIDQTFQLQVLNNTNNVAVEWVSLDSDIVKVTNGELLGLKNGVTSVRAMVGDRTLVCRVTVTWQEQLLLQLTLKNELRTDGTYRLNLLKGDSYSITPALVGKTEVQGISFDISSSNDALVIAGSTITGATAVENAIVKVSCSYEGKTYEIDVIVSVYEEV